MSIEELNATDLPTLREKLVNTPLHDDRPAIVKVLDWLDLGRNAAWNLIAPGIAARKKAAGETGALGLGEVHASDVLNEMGIHSHVVRGILGFGLDLATDPLMYVGGVGGVARVAGEGGKAVDILQTGAKAVRKADKALAAGKWVDEAAHPEVAGMLRAAGHTPESVAALAPAERAGLASKTILGDIKAGGLASMVVGDKAATGLAERLSRVGSGFTAGGGDLAKYAGTAGLEGTEAAKSEAANAFVRRYGYAASPGWKIGQGGQQVFHLPLTSYSIQIPALGATGKEAVALQNLARGAGVADRATAPEVTAVKQGVDAVEAMYRSHQQATAAEDAAGAGLDGIELANHTRNTEAARAARTQARDTAVADLQNTVANSQNVIRATPTNAADLAALRPMIDRSNGLAEKIRTEGLNPAKNLMARHAQLTSDANEAATTPFKDMDRLAVQQWDRISGYTFAPTDQRTGEVLVPKDPDLYNATMARARPVLDQLEKTDAQISELGAMHRPPVEEGGLHAATMNDQAGLEAQAADAARADQLRQLTDQRQTLRATLSETTRPMREASDLHTIPQAQAAAREHWAQRLAPEDRDVFNISAADRERLSVDADWMHARMSANSLLAKATGASILNYMDKAERSMAWSAARVLGTDSAIMGSTPLMPLKSALDYFGLSNNWAYKYAEKFDHGMAAVFGNRTGDVGRLERWYKNTLSNESKQVAQEAVVRLREGLKKALLDNGLSPIDHLDDAARVAYALAIDEASKASGDKFNIWTTKLGGTEPAQFLSDIAEAQNKGLFSKDATGNLERDLRAVAKGDTGLDLLRMMGDMESTDEMLNARIRGYVPLIPTQDTRSAIKSAIEYAATSEGKTATGKARGALAESFQKQRQASLEYRFISHNPETAGKELGFLHSDLGTVQAFTDAEKAAIMADPTAGDLKELFAKVDEYLKMPNRPEPKYLDALEMNRMYQEGRFRHLTQGNPLPGGFMDANLVSLMAARTGMHERAAARRTLQEWARNPAFGVSVDAKGVQGILQNAEGTEIRLKDGSLGRIKNVPTLTGSTVPGLERGGRIYRPLSAETSSLKNNPIINALDLEGEGTTRLFEDRVARVLEEAGRIWGTEENVGAFLKVVDKITGEWKRLALFHPSWLISNLIGDNLNNFMGGARVADFGKHATNAIRLFMNQHDPAAMERIVFDVGGQKINGRELFNLVHKHRIADMTLASELPNQLIQAGAMSVPSSVGERGLVGAIKNPKQAAMMVGRDYEAFRDMYAAAAGMKEAGPLQKFRAGDHVFDDRVYQWMFGPWQRLNQHVSNVNRTLAFLSHLEQGNDVVGAAQKTIRSAFDYSDLTRIEKDWFRRMIPFYSWVKNNGVYQTQLLLHRPIFAGAYPLLQNAIEESIDGEQKVPQYMRPNWMREALAMQIGKDPDHRFFLLPRTVYTPEQALTALEPLVGKAGVQDFLHYFVTQANPVFTKAVEYGTGREFFSGREINPDPLLSEVGTGGFAADLIPPVADIKRVAKATREGGVGAGLQKFVLGGRVQSGSDERLSRMTLRDFKQTDEALRRTISRAEAEGDKGTSLKGRVRLFQTYNAMIRAGHEKEVPKWARISLTRMQAQPVGAPG